MRASTYDPRSGVTAEVVVPDVAAALVLIDRAGDVAPQRGHPTVEFLADDGASLAVSTGGRAAFLVWVDSHGDSFHSTGDGLEEPLVFDYFGSWSEAPPEHLVPRSCVAGCLRAFFSHGLPATDEVVFMPD